MEFKLITAELCSVLYSLTNILTQLLTSCVESAIYIFHTFASNFFCNMNYNFFIVNTPPLILSKLIGVIVLDDLKHACIIDDKINSTSGLLCS